MNSNAVPCQQLMHGLCATFYASAPICTFQEALAQPVAHLKTRMTEQKCLRQLPANTALSATFSDGLAKPVTCGNNAPQIMGLFYGAIQPFPLPATFHQSVVLRDVTVR